MIENRLLNLISCTGFDNYGELNAYCANGLPFLDSNMDINIVEIKPRRRLVLDASWAM